MNDWKMFWLSLNVVIEPSRIDFATHTTALSISFRMVSRQVYINVAIINWNHLPSETKDKGCDAFVPKIVCKQFDFESKNPLFDCLKPVYDRFRHVDQDNTDNDADSPSFNLA